MGLGGGEGVVDDGIWLRWSFLLVVAGLAWLGFIERPGRRGTHFAWTGFLVFGCLRWAYGVIR